jgi:2-aminobenzoate-CoA ligase
MTGHIDTFAKDNLPPKNLWPVIDYFDIDRVDYPRQLNCAVELLDKAIEKGWGNKTCLIGTDGTWTYNQLLEKVNQISNYLVSELSVLPGNRVLLHGPNTMMLAACWFAVVKVGGICVTTMPLLRAKEITYICQRVKIKHALIDSRCISEVSAVVNEYPQLNSVVTFCSDSPESLEHKINPQPKTFSACKTDADDVALIAFTSGTTGKAKATMHFHKDVMTICDSFPKWVLKPKQDDVFAGTPPLAFTFGLGGILLFPIRYGASSVLLEKPTPAELISAIQKHKITTLVTSPTGYRGILEAINQNDISSLRKCVSAGETLPKATFTAWLEATGIKIIDGIGATEMLHIFISTAEDQIRPGSTGKVIPGYQACIMDEKGNQLAPNNVGLLAVRGPTGCRYLDDIDRQAGYVRDGWNYTGDAYLMDEDGYFWFQARADDMIISSGYNISANEVENILLSHPIVKECGVVGKPDPQRGHIVKAFVVINDQTLATEETAKLLQDFVKSEIAPYKYPREIEFVSSLPRTETGKLQRFRLRLSIQA